jgi:hypothetical protein
MQSISRRVNTEKIEPLMAKSYPASSAKFSDLNAFKVGVGDEGDVK